MPHLQNKRNLVMPVALVGGAVFCKWMEYVTFLSPYLIFAMLLITFCKLSPRQIKPQRIDLILLAIQIGISAAVYAILSIWNHTLAEGVFICVFVPTATAAPVITSLLGGNITRVVTYSLVCNLFVAIAGPIILTLVGDHSEFTFGKSFIIILSQVSPLLLLPLIFAFTLQKIWPSLYKQIAGHQQISFYIWAISLFIIVGSCVSFAINTWTPESTWLMASLSIGAGVVCIIQFYVGRKFGKKYSDEVSAGQSLMQKNTVLAVWLALTYMNPIASIGPAAYIIFQNVLNSWQIARHDNHL